MFYDKLALSQTELHFVVSKKEATVSDTWQSTRTAHAPSQSWLLH